MVNNFSPLVCVDTLGKSGKKSYGLIKDRHLMEFMEVVGRGCNTKVKD